MASLGRGRVRWKSTKEAYGPCEKAEAVINTDTQKVKRFFIERQLFIANSVIICNKMSTKRQISPKLRSTQRTQRLKIAPRLLFSLDSFEQSFKISLSKALRTFSLNDLKEK